MVLEVLPSGKGIGAEVRGIDLARPLAPGVFAAIHAAWLEHQVLLFRGQRLGDAALVGFTRHFGTPQASPRSEVSAGFGDYAPSLPEVTIISNILVGGQPIGSLGAGEADWHADMTFIETPPSACMLYALELPPEGGNTMFCSMTRAAATLPPALAEAVRGRRAIHDYSMTSAGDLRKGFERVSDVRLTPGARHPLIVRHPESGRPALLLGRRRNAYILGLEVEASERLLDALWAHACRKEAAFEQVWRVGDLVLWDNRSVMHRRDPFDAASRRLLHRTQVLGQAPIAA
jgi:taurine dioxygenase